MGKQTKMGPKQVVALAKEASEIMDVLEAQKRLYARLDELTLALKDQEIGRLGLMVVDNFAQKNVAFRVAGVKRFELKRVK